MRVKHFAIHGWFGFRRSNQVCDDCKHTQRAGSKCTKCGGEMKSIGFKLRVPRSHQKDKMEKVLKRKFRPKRAPVHQDYARA
jgi:tRNA(Ile2) C34 agmatinyltransferase TiaS